MFWREFSPHRVGLNLINPMQQRFSMPLISKCQQVIFKQTGQKISEDRAVLYLEKFARLMMVTVKIMQQSEAKKSKNKSNGKNN